MTKLKMFCLTNEGESQPPPTPPNSRPRNTGQFKTWRGSPRLLHVRNEFNSAHERPSTAQLCESKQTLLNAEIYQDMLFFRLSCAFFTFTELSPRYYWGKSSTDNSYLQNEVSVLIFAVNFHY